jgi:DNA-binding ferritin-like protein
MDLPITLGITIEKVCNTLMEARVAVQLNHWAIKPNINLALHEALGELYEGLNDKIDGFVESAQGTYNRVFVLVINSTSTESNANVVIQQVVTLREFLLKARSVIQHSHLQNQLDEFLTLVNQILYKIK